jgi:hypothetical protein
MATIFRSELLRLVQIGATLIGLILAAIIAGLVAPFAFVYIVLDRLLTDQP